MVKSRLLPILLAVFMLSVAQRGDVVVAAKQAEVMKETFDSVEGLLPVGWTEFVGGKVQLSTDTAFSGGRSLLVEDVLADASAGLRSAAVPVTAGSDYTASTQVWVKSGDAQIYLEFWNDKGTRIDVAIGSERVNSNWSKLSVVRTAPPDAKTATILLYAHKTNIGVAYYDDVVLTETKGSAKKLEQFATLQVKRPQYPDRLQSGSTDFKAQLEGHPRLYFTADELAKVTQRSKDDPNAFGLNYPVALQLLQQTADTYYFSSSISITYYNNHMVSYPLPPKQPARMDNPPGFTIGRYPYWTALGNMVRERLEVLSQAYALTGKSRYGALAKTELMSMVDWDVWSDPSYNCGGQTCLDTGYITTGVATAYDLLYDLLSPEERAQVRKALITKGLQPLYVDTNQKIDHNIHMVRTSALGYGALAILGEEPDMEKYIKRAYENFVWYLNQRLDSGETEGLMYTSLSTDYIVGFAEALERVTGDRTMFSHPYVKDVLPRWVVYFQGPNSSGLTNFGDSSVSNYYFRTMAAIGRVNRNAQANWYVSSYNVGSPQAKVLHLDPQAEIAPPTNWPTSAVFPNIGWAALRSGWDRFDTLLAFVSSGSRMGHNHRDQNSFIVNVGGEWLLTDPGYQDYQPGPKNDVTFGTLGHNAILVNGKGQTSPGGGQISAAFLSSSLDYIVGNATRSYAGLGLSAWERGILFVKPGYIILLDEMAFDDATYQPELLLHYNGTLSVDGAQVTPGYQGSVTRFAIKKGRSNLIAQLVSPSRIDMSVQTVAGAETYGPYISLQPQAGEHVPVVTILQPAIDDAPAIQVTDVEATASSIRFTVQRDKVQDHINLNLRMADTDSAVGSKGAWPSDGLHSLVSVTDANVVQHYALMAGKSLVWQDKELVSSPVELSVSVSQVGEEWVAEVNAAAPANVKFWVPKQGENDGQWVTVPVVTGENRLVLPQ